ncbi:hypothetical protein [Marinilabilia sp.]|uniref:COG3014 family protein n=1 Tax=Marinilabilia sp. TaxID=2021252 RepID=UPI0025B80338|nr:hypothetical protein [Marinilabilia sp.]
MARFQKVILFSVLALFVGACATFYQKTYQVQSSIANGNFKKAEKLLASDTKWAENNHRVLYFMNRGVVSFMMNDYRESIDYLNKADYYIEDFSKNYGWEALSLISNPMVKPYRPEDFEAVMVHFYKSLAFLALNDYEGALVEARRVNIRLQQINDKYKDHKNKYQRDAFAHNLMGMIYEAAGDNNDAFIAYRNALEIYETDYKELFGMEAPHQLKKDLLSAAKKTGFSDKVRFYEDKFNLKTPAGTKKDQGELVVFWLNGMGPIKEEWQITISNYGMSNGVVALGNQEMGLNYTYSANSLSSREKAAFKNLSFLRVAFPKYRERSPVFSQGSIQFNGETIALEQAENINKIAYQSLQDRMVRELGSSLLRLATKKAMEELAANENENLGTIVSIINAMTEKADTRNWQSLPYSVSYARIPMPAGQHTLHLNFSGHNSVNDQISVNIQAGKTSFFTYHTMTSTTF